MRAILLRAQAVLSSKITFWVFLGVAVATSVWTSLQDGLYMQSFGLAIAIALVSSGLMGSVAFLTKRRSPLARYILKQFAWTFVLLMGVTYLLYVLTMVSGDPAVTLAGSRASEEVVNNIREVMGLNDPLFIQYPRNMWNWMRGDFGESLSLFKGQPVWGLLKPRMILSLSLGIPSLVIAYGVGTAIGVISATSNVRFFFGKRAPMILDTPPILTALFFSAVPALIFVPTLIWLLVIKLPWLPASGWEGLFSLHAVIPIIALSVPGIAGIALLVRASCLRQIEEPFVVTARAKGVKRWRILIHHVLRNSLMPLTTQVTASLAGLITGSLFVELQYGIPGMGRLMLDAVGARDFSIYSPMTMMIVVLFIFGVRAADLVYTVVDPRVALEGKRKA